MKVGNDPIYMTSPCNSAIENYTEIFYTFYKGDVSSFQRKMSFSLSMSTGEAHGLNLFFIDLYVPELKSRSTAVSSHCSFLRTYVSLRSVAYIYV